MTTNYNLSLIHSATYQYRPTSQILYITNERPTAGGKPKCTRTLDDTLNARHISILIVHNNLTRQFILYAQNVHVQNSASVTNSTNIVIVSSTILPTTKTTINYAA